jgi:hypothetical protein
MSKLPSKKVQQLINKIEGEWKILKVGQTSVDVFIHNNFCNTTLQYTMQWWCLKSLATLALSHPSVVIKK